MASEELFLYLYGVMGPNIYMYRSGRIYKKTLEEYNNKKG
jgi:hypothetical protein